MPLIKSKSDKAFKANVSELIRSGKPRDQALAISYRIKRDGLQRKADGGMVDRLPEHYADIGASRIEDRRDTDPTLRAMGLIALKTRASGKQARNRMASDMGSAEIVDMMVPRGYADGGSADDGMFGYRIRNELYPGEEQYFKANPHVSGMAAETGDVILNPYSLPEINRDAVAKNEAFRLHLRNKGIVPTFALTDEQRKAFSGTPYEGKDEDLKATIAARIYSGDPSAKATLEQERWVKSMPQYADGGAMDSPYAGMMPKGPDSGFIPGPAGGRADTKPKTVERGAYILPSDIVSAAGDGNSIAGAAKLGKMFNTGPFGAKNPKIKGRPLKTTKIIRQRFQDGGMMVEDTADILASDGEMILEPAALIEKFGDLDLAHEALDQFVLQMRKQNVKKLSKLPPPKTR